MLMMKDTLSPMNSHVLYVESILILCLSIISCTWVVASIFMRRRQQAHMSERRRDREIRQFLDFTVVVLLGFELIQSINWLIGTIISEYLYGRNADGVTQGRPMDISTRESLTETCKIIGAFTYATDIFLYLWNACLAYSMYSWVVKKALLRHLYDQMKCLAVLAIMISILITLVPIVNHSFGARQDVTCWLADLSMTNTAVILNKIFVLPLCWIFVGYMYTITLAYIWRQPRTLSSPITASYQRLRRRLLLFAFIFFTTWFLNSIWYFLLSANMAHIVLGLIGKLYYAVGLLDSMAYGYGSGAGKVLSNTKLNSGKGEATYRRASASVRRRSWFSSFKPEEHDEIKQSDTESTEATSCRIFTTSLNCGQCTRVKEIGCIEEWIPKYGYDLYVVAFQECRMANQLRKTIHHHLGGVQAFHLFYQELGDTVVSNGKIALLVYARQDDVANGVLKLAEPGGKGRVASGIDLVFSRFHNKGVVGLALQYYDTAIAFLVAHFASDSGGRKRWERRDEDAWRTLHMLHLGGDVEDFDVHLQHHHVILLGDLNYRCQVFSGEILGKIAASAEVEKARRGWAAYSGQAWRDDSYNRFFKTTPHAWGGEEARNAEARLAEIRNPYSGEEDLLPDVNGERNKCPLGHLDEDTIPKEEVRHWEWVCEVDELSLSRRAGLALYGFKEGPLTFPPTFKFYPGRSVEDYADVGDLKYAYQVTKGEVSTGGWAKDSRPPSWTDRALYHSLPGLEGRLVLEAYDTCDAITGSDHRPVVASFQLLVDRPAQIIPPLSPAAGPVQNKGLFGTAGWGFVRHYSNPKVNEETQQQQQQPEQHVIGLETPCPIKGRAIKTAEAGAAAVIVLEMEDLSRPAASPRAPSSGAYPCLSLELTGGSSVSTNYYTPIVLLVRLSGFIFYFQRPSRPNVPTRPSAEEIDLASSVMPDWLLNSDGEYEMAEADDPELGPPLIPPLMSHSTSSMMGPAPPSLVHSSISPHSSFSRSRRREPCKSSFLFHYASGLSASSNGSNVAISEEDIGSIVILLPIACEDPFITHRRITLLDPSLANATHPKGEMTDDEEEHLHRFDWADVKRRGELRMQANVVPSLGMHAAIKILDRQGGDMGQGVICLKEMLERGAASSPQAYSMKLTCGGIYCGMITMLVALKTKSVGGGNEEGEAAGGGKGGSYVAGGEGKDVGDSLPPRVENEEEKERM